MRKAGRFLINLDITYWVKLFWLLAFKITNPEITKKIGTPKKPKQIIVFKKTKIS